MKTLTKLIAGAALTSASMAIAAAPADAQYYSSRRDDSARQIIGAIATVGSVLAATQRGYGDPYYGGRYQDPRYGYGQPGYGYGQPGYGYGRPGYGNNGFDRVAVNACSYEAQRRYARYGGARIDIRDVQYARNGVRVLGAVLVDGNRGYDRYNRYDRYGRGNAYAQRVAFTCDVRGDGRVSRFRTHNYNW